MGGLGEITTQAKNIIDYAELTPPSRVAGIAEAVEDVAQDWTAPVQEVYASVPEIKMFTLGALFSALIFTLATLLAKI